MILLISLCVMVYAATSLSYELKLSLNTIWGIPYAYSVGPIQFIKNRLFALAVIIGIGFVVLTTIIINAVISLLVSLFLIDNLLTIAGLPASFGVIIVLIALFGGSEQLGIPAHAVPRATAARTVAWPIRGHCITCSVARKPSSEIYRRRNGYVRRPFVTKLKTE